MAEWESIVSVYNESVSVLFGIRHLTERFTSGRCRGATAAGVVRCTKTVMYQLLFIIIIYYIQRPAVVTISYYYYRVQRVHPGSLTFLCNLANYYDVNTKYIITIVRTYK